ncbi:MAG: hypothetical protein WC934_08440 [Acidithiobacillus sp.]|jgi:hypothetical protein
MFIHPELQEGEMWLTNINNDYEFNKISYKTKRIGKVAYNIYGKVIKDIYISSCFYFSKRI